MTTAELPRLVFDPLVEFEPRRGDVAGAPSSWRLPTEVEFLDYDAGLGLRRVVVGPLATNCWAVFSLATGTALIVDPGDEPDTIIEAVRDLDLVAVVLTGAHSHDALGLRDVAAHFGVPVLMNPDDRPVWPHELDDPQQGGHFDDNTATDTVLKAGHPLTNRPVWNGAYEPLLDGQRLRLGPLSVEVMHTSGHTPGELSLLAGNHALTGNALVPGVCGLDGGSMSTLATTSHSNYCRLLNLRGTQIIHPGHGPSITIGQSRPCRPGRMIRNARNGLIPAVEGVLAFGAGPVDVCVGHATAWCRADEASIVSEPAVEPHIPAANARVAGLRLVDNTTPVRIEG